MKTGMLESNDSQKGANNEEKLIIDIICIINGGMGKKIWRIEMKGRGRGRTLLRSKPKKKGETEKKLP